LIVSAIVAAAKNRVIGHNNQIPWYLSADLKYFRKTTTGHHVIMGRKSFESIGRPLPNRTNIVISRDPFFLASGCLVAHSLGEALAIAAKNGETEAFVIGGGDIYRQSMHLLDKIYLTEVKADVPGDVFFPVFDEGEWAEVFCEEHSADEKNDHDYTFRVLNRKISGTFAPRE
jgi:dihydrofolate reductase